MSPTILLRATRPKRPQGRGPWRLHNAGASAAFTSAPGAPAAKNARADGHKLLAAAGGRMGRTLR